MAPSTVLCCVVLAAVAAAAAASDPHGSYCGALIGIVKLQVDIPTPYTKNYVNITGAVFGVKQVCNFEAAVYYPGNHSVALPNVTNPEDCLAKALSTAGAPTFTITYDDSADEVVIDADGEANIKLKPGTCKFSKADLADLRPLPRRPHGGEDRAIVDVMDQDTPML